MIVYHPREWSRNWPKDSKPYKTLDLCRKAHPEVPEAEVVQTPFSGNISDVVCEEAELVTPVPVPVEPEVPEEVPEIAPEVAPAPAPKPAKKKKKKKVEAA